MGKQIILKKLYPHMNSNHYGIKVTKRFYDIYILIVNIGEIISQNNCSLVRPNSHENTRVLLLRENAFTCKTIK